MSHDSPTSPEDTPTRLPAPAPLPTAPLPTATQAAAESTVPPPGSVPPPPGAEYFDRAYQELRRVHKQQMQRFAELHDEGGVIQQLFRQNDLVLHEVRQLGGLFGAVLARVAKLEERADENDRFRRQLEQRRAMRTDPAPPPVETEL